MGDSRIYDGLTKDQRYRLKDLDAYRNHKREYAKTPEQREKRRLYQSKWREVNREKYNEWARVYHHKNKTKWDSRRRWWVIKSKYHITEEDYQKMFEAQNGVCKICGNPPYEHAKNKMSKVLHIDHDHVTGKIRGLLCSRCNGALGWYEKCSEEIKSYLNENNGKEEYKQEEQIDRPVEIGPGCGTE
jgi:hypothetical protein